MWHSLPNHYFYQIKQHTVSKNEHDLHRYCVFCSLNCLQISKKRIVHGSAHFFFFTHKISAKIVIWSVLFSMNISAKKLVFLGLVFIVLRTSFKYITYLLFHIIFNDCYKVQNVIDTKITKNYGLGKWYVCDY